MPWGAPATVQQNNIFGHPGLCFFFYSLLNEHAGPAAKLKQKIGLQDKPLSLHRTNKCSKENQDSISVVNKKTPPYK